MQFHFLPERWKLWEEELKILAQLSNCSRRVDSESVDGNNLHRSVCVQSMRQQTVQKSMLEEVLKQITHRKLMIYS